MKGKQLGWGGGPWLLGVLVVAISALVGYWHAQPLSSPESTRYEEIELVDHSSNQIEKIEQALAQAGCPGWMVLASEGPSVLGSQAIPPEIRTISASVPRVQYPQPIRVASRPTTEAVATTPGDANDPDDLLDGTADLLWKDIADPEQEKPPVDSGENDSSIESPASESPDDTSAVEESASQGQPSSVVEPEPNSSSIEKANQPVPAPVLLPEPKEEITPREDSPFSAPPKPGGAPHSLPSQSTGNTQPGVKSYCEFVADSRYPSAFACATCHEKIFEEWSVSSHAYAAVSPMFQKFEQKINDISQATIGYFCYRCHSPAGVSLGISRAAPLWDMPQVAREGVTCVACHRVNQRYGKVNGERRIEPGDMFAPVYGSIGGSGVAEVIDHKNDFKVKTSPWEQGPGQDIHVAGCYFDQLSKPEFCVSCHQVAVQPGIKLEVVWEQYRASPACKKGISCQDCHMGRLPGVASGYETGPAAVVNGKTIYNHRKHANHVFYGPGYSIAHPGVFPFNKDALRWSMPDWLQFDYRAGWGTEEFEEAIAEGLLHVNFPPVWANVDDRYDARDVIDANLKKLGMKDVTRHQIMENGSHVDGPFFDKPLVRGHDLRFHYIVTNRNDGHNMPSGSLGAQPQLWANVVLIGPRGQRIWESGYTDRWGDVADIHSEDVRHKRIPYDWQLFNLQTMFLITGATGTDREFFLPVNVDIDQLPYLRPGAQPISVMNHPPFIRMEGRSLAPLGSRRAPYKVPAELIQEPGCYRLSFRLRMRTQPIYFMRFCGATIEMQRAMNEGITNFHHSSYEFEIR